MNKNLHARTKELLENRPRGMTLDIIADEAGVKRDWLRSFSAGRIRNPGVETVQTLHDFLASRVKLEAV